MKYGYIRPIVGDQQTTEQLANLTIDTIYVESHGLAKQRVELERLLMDVQSGDTLYVQNIEVLADSLQQLWDILRLAERDQLIINFVDEQLTNQTMQSTTLLQNVEFFAKLQTTFLSHSSTFSLQVAKQQGKTIGRPRKSDDNLQRAFEMYDSKNFTLFDIKEETGISKSTLYRYLDERAASYDKQ
ncbi:recombinase family protein [Sporosarcina ureae]|uniref:Resolvase/invertase-type recombinase catalytic domain-containing protein n=1 Tax=Sporosarcina ureae TaxID=1571 RepID=A0ABN4YRD0_SPOUR|nr:recombinase family protein [Sporosarcina ureae]ARF13924.1 hypothetical protein SporoS204_07065 [Sporosarcina ureae]